MAADCDHPLGWVRISGTPVLGGGVVVVSDGVGLGVSVVSDGTGLLGVDGAPPPTMGSTTSQTTTATTTMITATSTAMTTPFLFFGSGPAGG